MARPTINYRHLTLAIKYASVLFPFDVALFLRSLSKEGFMLPESTGPVPQVPLGRKLEGKINMMKGDVSVRVDTERYILVVQALDVGDVLAEMDTIESLLRNEFGLDNPNLAHYYEFVAGFTIRAEKNPMESWYNHFGQAPLVREFSEALGMNVSPFGIRLSVREEPPNQVDWFEIRFEPLIQSATTHHMVEVVFRNSLRDKVFDFAEKFEDSVYSLVSLVDQG